MYALIVVLFIILFYLILKPCSCKKHVLGISVHPNKHLLPVFRQINRVLDEGRNELCKSELLNITSATITQVPDASSDQIMVQLKSVRSSPELDKLYTLVVNECSTNGKIDKVKTMNFFTAFRSAIC